LISLYACPNSIVKLWLYYTEKRGKKEGAKCVIRWMYEGIEIATRHGQSSNCPSLKNIIGEHDGGCFIMSRLLLNEEPLLVMPQLAIKIGLNESLILQQIHYWIEINKKANQNKRDGYYWTYNSYEQWQKQFPFWCSKTIQRAINTLEKMKLIVSDNYNRLKIDRTKWYRIDYKVLEVLESSPFGQIDLTNMTEWVNHVDKLLPPLPETKPKINSEINKRIGSNSISFAEFLLNTNITDYESNVDAVYYYLKKYKKVKHKEHPKCTWQEWNDVIVGMFENDVLTDVEDSITDIIDRHFEKTFKQYNHDIRSFHKFIDNDIYEAGII